MTTLRFAADVVEAVAPNDTIFRWVALIIGQAIILVGLILTYLSTRHKATNISDQVSAVGDQATLAAKLAEPTGNGYADWTKDALRRNQDALQEIKDLVVRVEHKVDTHIQDHAAASFKD